MKRRYITVSLCAALFIGAPAWLLSRSGGAPPRSTGGDFPGEQSCASAGCHTSELNSGPGSVSIQLNGQSAEEFRYQPGGTVPVVVSVSEAGMQRWGFQLTARNEDGCLQAGAFNVSSEDTEVMVTTAVGAPDGCAESTIEFPTHSFPKSGGDGATFTVDWTAPAADFGPVRFAAAVNAANGNNNPTGDNIYSTEATIEPAAALPAPQISDGGVVLATLSPAVRSGSANAILTAFGTGFVPEGSEFLVPGLDEEGNVAKELGGVCLEAEGERAPIFAVTSGQVNFQAPSESPLGPVNFVVVSDCGGADEQRSEAVAVEFASAAPAFFLFSGSDAIAATDGSGAELIAPADLFGEDVTARPAEPGELVSLFATGFGATEPAFDDGEIPLNAPDGPTGDVTGEVSVSIGDVTLAPEDISYAGVAPCCAGLYQLVVRAPETLPDGEHPVIVTIDGIASPEGPFLAVAQPEEP